MLSNSQLQEIAKRAGTTVQILTDAINGTEEKTIELSDDGVFMTSQEIQAVEARGEKIGHGKGKIDGYEMLVKEVKRLEGVEFEGKTAENIATALKTKYEKPLETNKAIEELTNDKKKLQALITEKESEFTTKVSEFESKLNKITIESQVKTKFPEKLDNGLTRDDLFNLYQTNRKINRTETGIELIDPFSNEVIKDKKLNPVKIEDDITVFLQRFGVAQDGRGGKNEPAKPTNDITGMKKHSEVLSYFEKNETPLSEQAAIMGKAMKNEGFNINE